ncbi:MAG: hypothetical protein LAN63_00475 [Acidobacteriia bacterium]|nr:hypothetical protein [Terriglobia bacterium]
MFLLNHLLDRLDNLSQRLPFIPGKVFLFILVEQQQQMDVLFPHKVKKEVSIASTLSLAPSGIRGSCFPYATQPLQQVSPFRAFQKVSLNPFQDFVGLASCQIL